MFLYFIVVVDSKKAGLVLADGTPQVWFCVFSLAVETMFSAMCECQALHPDPDDEDSDNDFEGEEYDVEEAGEETFTFSFLSIQSACI